MAGGLLFLITMLAPGCIPITQRGPAGSEVTRVSAAQELTRLSNDPIPLKRPIVVLSGYHTLAMHAAPLAAKVTKATSGKSEDVLLISYPTSSDIDDITQSVINQVEQRWPSSCPNCTVEVDVIGVSMGGIIARWAALPPAHRTRCGEPPCVPQPGSKRLNVARLFTYASPHRGAHLATTLALDSAAVDLKPGSPLLTALDQAPNARAFELTCYAHTGDLIVGATRTAPPGMNPIWTEGTVMFSHMAVVHNPIFIADTARRLRGEAPLVEPTQSPPRN
jgi:hypothetical protein